MSNSVEWKDIEVTYIWTRDGCDIKVSTVLFGRGSCALTKPLQLTKQGDAEPLATWYGHAEPFILEIPVRVSLDLLSCIVCIAHFLFGLVEIPIVACSCKPSRIAAGMSIFMRWRKTSPSPIQLVQQTPPRPDQTTSCLP